MMMTLLGSLLPDYYIKRPSKIQEKSMLEIITITTASNVV